VVLRPRRLLVTKAALDVIKSRMAGESSAAAK
jgi:hypothetical protein